MIRKYTNISQRVLPIQCTRDPVQGERPFPQPHVVELKPGDALTCDHHEFSGRVALAAFVRSGEIREDI